VVFPHFLQENARAVLQIRPQLSFLRPFINFQLCEVMQYNFHILTVYLDIIKVFYSPTDAQVNCLKNI